MKSNKLNFIEDPNNKVRKKDITSRIKNIIKVMDKITHSMQLIKFDTDNDSQWGMF